MAASVFLRTPLPSSTPSVFYSLCCKEPVEQDEKSPKMCSDGQGEHCAQLNQDPFGDTRDAPVNVTNDKNCF